MDPDPALLSSISLAVREQMNALLGKLRQQDVVVEAVLLLHDRVGSLRQGAIGCLGF